ncbi:collagen alpha-1(I) chain-like [Trachypithecus francoisi]|uniref:collagen alpha-1(I) chain-like n=1 Tax=Trachypithecus francoisi TaxID=54180 RepID=UPI00141A7778|nr:collagen alpha-1(I) chain-like [Trachypithecus francoisi]
MACWRWKPRVETRHPLGSARGKAGVPSGTVPRKNKVSGSGGAGGSCAAAVCAPRAGTPLGASAGQPLDSARGPRPPRPSAPDLAPRGPDPRPRRREPSQRVSAPPSRGPDLKRGLEPVRPGPERLTDSPGPHGRPSPHTPRRLPWFRSRTRPLPPRLSPGPAWSAGRDLSPGAHGCDAGASYRRCQWTPSGRRRHRLIAAPPPPAPAPRPPIGSTAPGAASGARAPPPTPLRALSSPRRRPRLCLSPAPAPRSRLLSAPRAPRSHASGTGRAVCPSRRRPGVGKRRWRGQDGRVALRIPRGGEEFRLRRLRSQDTGRSQSVSGITGLGLGHSLLRFPPGGLARRRRHPIPAQSCGASRDPARATPEPGPGSLGPLSPPAARGRPRPLAAHEAGGSARARGPPARPRGCGDPGALARRGACTRARRPHQPLAPLQPCDGLGRPLCGVPGAPVPRGPKSSRVSGVEFCGQQPRPLGVAPPTSALHFSRGSRGPES